MDNSQNSDIFSVSTSFSCNDNEPIDAVTYESLLVNIKKSLSKNVQLEVKNKRFFNHFTTLLEDCSICINQSLDLIVSLIEGGNVPVNSVCEYINNCVSLLQLLSNFIKTVAECVSMTCQSMKTFPLTTAQIILVIFKHCKDSESIYGSNLADVQTQLKDIFRSCHELQLTYLMLLDKHFVFDLCEAEEMDIFLQALDMNLKIGELVQSLDVKTMAEQWKGISQLCEKYAASLLDKNVFESCSSVLCKIVDENLDIAVQVNQEDKIILRSLKVSCFALKIVIKLSNTLKYAVVRDYRDVVETLCNIYLQNPAYLKLMDMPTTGLSGLIKTLVANPADVLLKDLVHDEQFINCIVLYDWDRIKKEDKFLGFILLLTNIMKLWLQLSLENQTNRDTNNIRLIRMLFSCVPFCQNWFNKRLEFTINDKCLELCGLYKYILIYTYNLCITLSPKQYIELEKMLYEAVMSVESVSALFASNLWVLLARETNPQTTRSQIATLLRTYQKLEKQALFYNSPQEVHLQYIIKQLFEYLNAENKVSIYKEFNINDEKNTTIWAILEVRKLPENLAKPVENNILETFKIKVQILLSEELSFKEITDLVKIMHLASTCRNTNDVISEIIQLWMKICPDRGFIKFNKEVDTSNIWYFQLCQALVMLTFSFEKCVWHNTDLIKILHVLSAFIDTDNIQLSLLATEAIYKLAQYDVIDSDNFNRLFHKIVSNILNDNILADNLVFKLRGNEKPVFLSKVAKEKSNSHRLSKLLSGHETYEVPATCIFKHKCLNTPVANITTASSSNFEFDIDSILDIDTSEPKCKKQKINQDIDAILTKIESDTLNLCDISNELNVNDKMRIKNICNSLNSICN